MEFTEILEQSSLMLLNLAQRLEDREPITDDLPGLVAATLRLAACLVESGSQEEARTIN